MQPNEMGDVPVVHSERMLEKQLAQVSVILDSPGCTKYFPIDKAVRVLPPASLWGVLSSRAMQAIVLDVRVWPFVCWLISSDRLDVVK